MRRALKYACLIWAGCLTIVITGTAFAQSPVGAIQVEVTDYNTKRLLGGVTVAIRSRENQSNATVSSNDGIADVKNLSPGLYSVQLTHPDYLSLIEPSIRVVQGKTTTLFFTLTPNRSNVEQIVVFGDKARLDSLSSAGSRYMGREELRSNAGSGSDILRALDGMPGLFSSGEFASYTVRGNGPRDNLIYVDGFPFDNIVHFDDSFGEQEDIEGGGRYSVFAPNLISGASFQPGGWEAAYGGKSGSMLRLDVADGNTETASYNARIDLAGFEVGYDGPSRFHDDTSILFSARRQDFGRFFERIGVNDVGSPENTDLILKTSSRLNDNHDLDVLFIHAPEKFNRDIDNVLASDEDDPGNYEDIGLENRETKNTLLGTTWTAQLSDGAIFTNRLYYRFYEEIGFSGEAYPDLVPEDTAADQVPVRNNILSSVREETEIGFRSDYTYWNAFGEFNIGARISQTDLNFSISLDDDWIQYEYDTADIKDNPLQRYIVFTPDTFNSRLDQKSRLYSLYADQTFEFSRWDFRTGLRVDRDDLASETIVSPRLSANWRMSDRAKMVFTAGRYHQLPRFNDRASDPDNMLQNEISDQLSVGLSYMLRPDLEVLVEPYYQSLSNLVVESDGVSQQFSNTGEGKSWGVDTALIKRFGNGWSANMNYSYNKAEVKDTSSGTFYDADFHRPHSFSVGGVWEINDRWQVSARYKWASGTPFDAFIIHDNVLGDGQILRFSKEHTSVNTERYSNFSALNFRVDYRRTFSSLSVIAFLDVINAMGSDNPQTTEFSERTGRDIVEEGEVLPILGLRLEF